MAKGDIKSRIMQGQQPGLAPINPMMNAISPTNMMGPHPVNTVEAPPNMNLGLGQPSDNARMMPMQSGTLQAQGKHPINTNPKRMLKYNSGY